MSYFSQDQQQAFFITSGLFVLTIAITNLFSSGKGVPVGGIKPWDATKVLSILLLYSILGWVFNSLLGPMNSTFEKIIIIINLLITMGFVLYVVMYKRKENKTEEYTLSVSSSPDGDGPKIGQAKQKLNNNHISKTWYLVPFGIYLLTNLFVLGIHTFTENFKSVEFEVESSEEDLNEINKEETTTKYSYQQDQNLNLYSSNYSGDTYKQQMVNQTNLDPFKRLSKDYFNETNREFVYEKVYGDEDLYEFQNEKYREQVFG